MVLGFFSFFFTYYLIFVPLHVYKLFYLCRTLIMLNNYIYMVRLEERILVSSVIQFKLAEIRQCIAADIWNWCIAWCRQYNNRILNYKIEKTFFFFKYLTKHKTCRWYIYLVLFIASAACTSCVTPNRIRWCFLWQSHRTERAAPPTEPCSIRGWSRVG